MLDRIRTSLKARGIEDEELAQKLCEYAFIIREENKKYNLTAILDDFGIAEKHFGDSLEALKFIKDAKNVCDVGSGGGLPVVPLALARKDVDFTAVEATGKKCNFLRLVSQNLNIGNLNVENCRIEDFAKGDKRQGFDLVTARAVAPLNTLLEYVSPLVKVGGRALVFKGSSYLEEMEEAEEAVKTFNIKVDTIFNYVLENGEKRVIIIFAKVGSVDDKYPRGGNRPRLKPIV